MSPAEPPRLSTLILLSALAVATLGLFLPSLPAIAAEFDVDPAVASLALGGYAAASAALQIAIGPLSDRYGRRPVILGALAVYVLASLGCALAPDIVSFLAFRLLQGSIVAGFVVSNAVVRDLYDARTAASKLGLIAAAWAIAPMLGPLLGGVLDETFGWRSSFVFFALAGAGLFALAWVDLGETNRNPAPCLAAQFALYPALLRSRRFWGYASCLGFAVGAFYAFLSGAPLIADARFEMSATALGFWMGTITAGFMAGNLIAAKVAAGAPLARMMAAGRLAGIAGMALGLGLYALGADGVLALFGPCLLVGLGNGLTMPSANAGAMSVRPDLAGAASGLTGATALLGGALFASLTGWALTAAPEPETLFAIMLAACALGLAAAWDVARLDACDAAPGAPASSP